MRVRLVPSEPDGVYSGRGILTIMQGPLCVGVAVRQERGWQATIWARPGKVRARWRAVLRWRVAASLRA